MLPPTGLLPTGPLLLLLQAGVPAPAALRPFETGVWLWCVLVCNVANLILAHRRWDSFTQGIPPEVLAQLPLRLKLRLLARGLTKVGQAQITAQRGGCHAGHSGHAWHECLNADGIAAAAMCGLRVKACIPPALRAELLQCRCNSLELAAGCLLCTAGCGVY